MSTAVTSSHAQAARAPAGCAPQVSSAASLIPSCKAWKAAQQARTACAGAAQPLPCGLECTRRPLGESSSQGASLRLQLERVPSIRGREVCHWVSYTQVAACAALHEPVPTHWEVRHMHVTAAMLLRTLLCMASSAADWLGWDTGCEVSSCSRAQGRPGVLATEKLVTLALLSTKRGSPLHAQSASPCEAAHAFNSRSAHDSCMRLHSACTCLLSASWDAEPCHTDWHPGRVSSVRVKHSAEVGGGVQCCRVRPEAIDLKILFSEPEQGQAE